MDQRPSGKRGEWEGKVWYFAKGGSETYIDRPELISEENTETRLWSGLEGH